MTRIADRSYLAPALLALCTALLYLPHLRDAPATLRGDEVHHALSARSIAATGRDPQGRFMPLIPQPGAPPVIVYAMAAIFTFAPVSETTARLPVVLAGVIDVLLVYAIGRMLFARRSFAILAAVLTMLTPTHFLFSRLALTAPMPVPFVLGWLLCLLVHFRRSDRRLLFAAGLLLVAGALAYFAVALLVPIYLLLSYAALYMRREPRSSYLSLTAGVVVPVAVCLPWLLLQSQEIRYIVLHYDWGDPRSGNGVGAIATLYTKFWDPRFLFADGAPRIEHSTRMVGVFLAPLAGLLLIGTLRSVRRASAETVLLLGGFFSAPLPASLVGEAYANWRALEVVPFATLLATFGLEELWAPESDRVRRTAFVATLVALIMLAWAYQGQMWRAQALLRAAVVPLAVMSLALVMRHPAVEPGRKLAVGGLAIAAFLAIQVMLYKIDYSTVIRLAPILLVLLGVVLLLPDAWLDRRRFGPLGGLVLLAGVASIFAYFHIERVTAAHVPLVRAGAVLPLARFVPAFAALLPAFALTLRRSGAAAQQPTRLAVVVAVAGLAALQVAYFHIDYFNDDRRSVQVGIVLLAAIVLVMLIRHALADRLTFASLAIGAVLALVSLQFGYFYADYFTSYQTRVDRFEGRTRIAMERAIEHAGGSDVPLIWFWGFGGYEERARWSFYLAKHHRADLESRSTWSDERGDAARERIRKLPAGSLVVTRPSDAVDTVVEPLVGGGALRSADLFRSPEGTPTFWILQRTAM